MPYKNIRTTIISHKTRGPRVFPMKQEGRKYICKYSIKNIEPKYATVLSVNKN